MKQGYEVIDAHCHIYPEKIAARAVAGTDRFYGTTAVCLGTTDDLLKENRRAGVDRSIVQSVATTPKQVRSINEFIAETVKNHPTELTGLGTLHPESADPEGDVHHLIELGLHGVKLHPDIQGFKMDDYRCLKIYELCEKEHLPILVHTGDSRYDYSNPNRLFPVLDIYRGLTVIGGHFGGWSMWETAYKSLLSLPNLYVDCSSSFPYMSKEAAVKVIRAYGAERVLFGTDYPMWSPASELDTFLSLGLMPEENRMILSENAKRLYSITD